MTPGGGWHEAYLYAGTDGFLAGALEFLGTALETGGPVLVMTDRVNTGVLRSALDGRGGNVTFADMAEIGHNPARIIPAWRAFADAHGRAPALWGIGEPVWAGRSAAEHAECRQHEALLNLAFSDADRLHLLCPYDTATLPATVIASARHTHPQVRARSGEGAGSTYRGVDVDALLAEPLPAPGDGARVVEISDGDLPGLRRHVEALAVAGGLSGERVGDLVLAVDEVVTNTCRYGERGALASWREDGAVVCEVRDAGRIRDPLVGRRRPPARRAGGRGLWIANQLCDLVQIRSCEPTGTTVRLHMRIDDRYAA